MRCVVVDDSQPFLASAARLLRSQGVEVVGCASSRAEALRLAADRAPDVVLVDIELGAEDGIALAHELLAAPLLVPVILISGHEPEDLAELIDDSTVRFLAKTSLGASAIRDLLSSAGP